MRNAEFRLRVEKNYKSLIISLCAMLSALCGFLVKNG